MNAAVSWSLKRMLPRSRIPVFPPSSEEARRRTSAKERTCVPLGSLGTTRRTIISS